MNIYLAPKRSFETNLSKNICFHSERSFWPIFPCLIECVNPEGTLYKCVQIILTKTLELSRTFFWDLGACWKHKFLKKKAIFPVKKKLWPSFSRNIQHDKCRGTFYKGPQGVLTIIGQTIWTFVWHLRGRQKRKFQKLSVFTMKEISGPIFLKL